MRARAARSASRATSSGRPSPTAELPGAAGADGAAAAVAALRRERRLFDRRRRPVGATLSSLVAAGGRLLVLVADVARRRPLLSARPASRSSGAPRCTCTAPACRRAWARPCAATAAETHPTSSWPTSSSAAANPELVGAFDHVAFVDPPFDGGLFGAILAAVAPAACVSILWGESEVDFTKAVVADTYDLEAACRVVYRALAAGGDADDPARARCSAHGPAGGLPALAAAWTTLSEAGLLADHEGKKGVRQGGGQGRPRHLRHVSPMARTIPHDDIPQAVPEHPALGLLAPEAEQQRGLLERVLAAVAVYNPDVDEELITRAFALAGVKHGGQIRKSGEDFINHPVGTALLCAELRLDDATIAAALLHDVVEDSDTPIEYIREQFGDEIAMLVDGVTKLTKISFNSTEEEQAENYRKMIVAMAEDIRVILIKLADRLHNMRTLWVPGQAEADPEVQGDPRDLRAAGPSPGHQQPQVAARRPGLRDPAPAQVRRDRAHGVAASRRSRGLHRETPRGSSKTSSPRSACAPRSPAAPSTSTRSTSR